MPIKYEEELWFLLISRGFPGLICTKYLVQHYFVRMDNVLTPVISAVAFMTWFDGRHYAKAWTVN